MKQKGKGWALLGNLGILPAILLAVFVAPLFGEAKWPDIQWGFSQPDFATLWSQYTVFGLGLPSLSFFITAIPAVFATYLVVFGDVLKTKALLSESDQVRLDEKVDYNPDRAHMIFGGRNMLMSLIGPDITMCGPMWAAMQVVVVERFKKAKSDGLVFRRCGIVSLGHEYRLIAFADRQSGPADSRRRRRPDAARPRLRQRADWRDAGAQPARPGHRGCRRGDSRHQRSGDGFWRWNFAVRLIIWKRLVAR